jgi:hypothetical protein
MSLPYSTLQRHAAAIPEIKLWEVIPLQAILFFPNTGAQDEAIR